MSGVSQFCRKVNRILYNQACHVPFNLFIIINRLILGNGTRHDAKKQ